MSRAGSILVTSILLLPLASATAGEGTFLLQRAPRLPPDSEYVFSPLFVFQNDTSGVGDFVLDASNVTLHYYEQPFSEIDTPPLAVQVIEEVERREHSYVHLRLTKEGSSAQGYVGLVPTPGGIARLAASRPPSFEARERTDAATMHWMGGPGLIGSQNRDDPGFRQTVTSPHVVCEAPGGLVFSGGGALKIFGIDVRVAAAGQEEVFRTGIERESEAPARDGARRWLVIEFEAGVLTTQSVMPWLIAASSAEASWDGEAFLEAVSGELTTEESRYVPVASRKASLTGSFTADLLPERAREGRGEVMLRMAVRGDLASTTLRQEALETAVPRVLSSFSPGLWLAGCLAFVAAAGVSGYAWGRQRGRGAAGAGMGWRRRGTSELPFSIEDCQEAGSAAAAMEDWASAADWFGRGLKLAPTSARLTCDLAYSLSQIGDHDQALRLFEEASMLSTDGEADFNGALAALRAGRSLEEVESWIERALARSPEFVAHLEEDDDFSVLKGRPRYEAAVADAWRAYPWRGRNDGGKGWGDGPVRR